MALGALCFPAVPVWIRHKAGIHGAFQRGAGVLRRLLSLRGAGVHQREGFVWVEGPVVMLRPRRTLCSVIRHPPEVLRRAVPALVVTGVELIGTSPFGVRVPERHYSGFSFFFKDLKIAWLLNTKKKGIFSMSRCLKYHRELQLVIRIIGEIFKDVNRLHIDPNGL